jgi:hypothetical protein
MSGLRGYIILLFCSVLLGFWQTAKASECGKLVPKVKQASEFVLGLEYPYWYNLGQIEAETNCLWKTSLDGWGSIGYAQLTEKFLPWLNEKFPNWKVKGHIDHFMAQAYLIKHLMGQVNCKKLWCVYQCYNRSCWKINREAEKANCVWERAFELCNEKFVENICVWKREGRCLQWRTSCDINYNYGYKVWKNGIKYRNGILEKTYQYW